jgi:hypothetical protein
LQRLVAEQRADARRRDDVALLALRRR